MTKIQLALYLAEDFRQVALYQGFLLCHCHQMSHWLDGNFHHLNLILCSFSFISCDRFVILDIILRLGNLVRLEGNIRTDSHILTLFIGLLTFTIRACLFSISWNSSSKSSFRYCVRTDLVFALFGVPISVTAIRSFVEQITSFWVWVIVFS